MFNKIERILLKDIIMFRQSPSSWNKILEDFCKVFHATHAALVTEAQLQTKHPKILIAHNNEVVEAKSKNTQVKDMVSIAKNSLLLDQPIIYHDQINHDLKQVAEQQTIPPQNLQKKTLPIKILNQYLNVFCCIKIEFMNHTFMHLIIKKGADTGNFSNHQKELIETLYHLIQTAFHQEALLLQSLTTSINSTSQKGIFFITPQQKIIHMNPFAKQLIHSTNSIFQLDERNLRFISNKHSERLTFNILKVSDQRQPQEFVLNKTGQHETVLAKLSPTPMSIDVIDHQPSLYTLTVLPDKPAVMPFKNYWNLSKREEQVCQLIYQGKDLNRISNLLRLSKHTVEDYWRSSKNKINIRSTNELSHKILLIHTL